LSSDLIRGPNDDKGRVKTDEEYGTTFREGDLHDAMSFPGSTGESRFYGGHSGVPWIVRLNRTMTG
ncbi:MAG: hypothetical protein WBE28_02355, partial [bacterium]